jgi:Ca2+-binding EF-hand superfamily protein
MMLSLLPLLLGAAAAGQTPASLPEAQAHRGGRTFISPMGEPFRSSGRDDDTRADWFRQADRNHDGYLTIEEMQQDAERFFAILDVNHDGEIDPDEITRYENEVAPEIQVGTRMGQDELDRDDGHLGAARLGLLDLPEPVVSADTNFNRGVSLPEFRQAASQRFVALDLNHHGRISIAEVEEIRPAPAPSGYKRKRQSERPDAPSQDQ